MFNRLKYDECASRSALKDNVSIFSHTVDINRFLNKDTCLHGLGIPTRNSVSTVGPQPAPDTHYNAWSDMVALESDLRGQTRENTRCPSRKFVPSGDVIKSNNRYKPSQKPIDASNKSHLKACQIIDHSNLTTAHKK